MAGEIDVDISAEKKKCIHEVHSTKSERQHQNTTVRVSVLLALYASNKIEQFVINSKKQQIIVLNHQQTFSHKITHNLCIVLLNIGYVFEVRKNITWFEFRHSYEIGNTRTDYYENENKLTENEKKKSKRKITTTKNDQLNFTIRKKLVSTVKMHGYAWEVMHNIEIISN